MKKRTCLTCRLDVCLNPVTILMISVGTSLQSAVIRNMDMRLASWTDANDVLD